MEDGNAGHAHRRTRDRCPVWMQRPGGVEILARCEQVAPRVGPGDDAIAAPGLPPPIAPADIPRALRSPAGYPASSARPAFIATD